MGNQSVRQLVLFALLLASLAMAIYTYWPILAIYYPGLRLTKQTAVTTTTTTIPTPPAAIKEGSREAEAIMAALPAEEAKKVRMIDPFALRIPVKRKMPLAPPPPPGSEKSKETVKKPGLWLEGIWIDSGMRIAFISGQALEIGGSIMGWKVASISRDQVVLRKGSTIKTLKMGGN